jgi:glucokinase
MSRPVIGLDAGGTKLLAGLVEEDGSVAHAARYQWPEPRTRDGVLETIATGLDDALRHVPGAGNDPIPIGLGIPATVDIATGVASACAHLPLAGVGVAEWIREQTGREVFVDNDATLALLAEARLGAARGAGDAVMLTIGTGIGGALMSGGSLVRGASGAAGEPGHMTIDADGPPCRGDCPGRGCLETYVSGPALAEAALAAAGQFPTGRLAKMRDAHGGTLTGALALAAARDGDGDVLRALERMAEHLGAGIASLLNLLEPEVVVVGGGFASDAGELLLAYAEQVARGRALEPAASRARIVGAELGERAGMIGAALLARAGGAA